MERLLGAISTTLNRDLPSKLGETMRGELNNLSSALAVSLTPAVQQAVSSALPKETAAAVKTALDKQLGVSLQSGLTKPIQEAFRTAFSKQIVPSFENACQSMFVQKDSLSISTLLEALLLSLLLLPLHCGSLSVKQLVSVGRLALLLLLLRQEGVENCLLVHWIAVPLLPAPCVPPLLQTLKQNCARSCLKAATKTPFQKH